jgi:hypothetical protein
MDRPGNRTTGTGPKKTKPFYKKRRMTPKHSLNYTCLKKVACEVVIAVVLISCEMNAKILHSELKSTKYHQLIDFVTKK